MIKSFKRYFSTHMVITEDTNKNLLPIRVAAAALLIEVARADFNMDDMELTRISEILQNTLELDAQELDELMAFAESESINSTSLHEFTRLIHAEYTLAQKVSLFEQLWRVAYADGNLDKYEEYLLRKIADLIYLPHQYFIQSKHKVLAQLK